MAQHVDTHTVHTIVIDLEDKVVAAIEYGDEVRVVFRSRAQNKTMAPLRLSPQAIERLTRDY